MKIIAVILSVCVIFLSVIPCCWEDYCNEEMTIEYSAETNQEQDSDFCACSPFFSCGTCVGFTLTAGLDLKEVIHLLTNNTPTFQDKYFDSFSVKIWQPPKLS